MSSVWWSLLWVNTHSWMTQLTGLPVVIAQAQTVMKQMLWRLGKEKIAPDNVENTQTNKIWDPTRDAWLWLGSVWTLAWDSIPQQAQRWTNSQKRGLVASRAGCGKFTQTSLMLWVIQVSRLATDRAARFSREERQGRKEQWSTCPRKHSHSRYPHLDNTVFLGTISSGMWSLEKSNWALFPINFLLF